MSENDLLTGLLEAALASGWMVHHSDVVHDMRSGTWRTPLRGSPGLPDLLLAHEERGLFLAIETKSDIGRLEPNQERWHAALRAAGIEIRVVRPADYDITWRFLVGGRLVRRRGS